MSLLAKMLKYAKCTSELLIYLKNIQCYIVNYMNGLKTESKGVTLDFDKMKSGRQY